MFIASLPDYFTFLNENRDSLMARIYGVFTVKMEDLTPVHVLLMSNAARVESREIRGVYDLKGSIINREVKGINPQGTLKDVNLINRTVEDIILLFRLKDREKIMAQMLRDIQFLEEHNLMDYSLLVIIETNPKFTEAQTKRVMRRKDTLKSLSS